MKKSPPYLAIIGGIFALVIAMGVGRFAYTPILPFMLGLDHFYESLAGYLASSNYLGYLLGAIVTGSLKWKKGKAFYIKIYLIISVLTTILMGVTEHYSWWLVLRFVSGFSSGVIFVLVSSVILDLLFKSNRSSWSGIFYGGVGLGIVFSGLFVFFIEPYFGWHGTWIGLGLFCVIFGLTILWVKDQNQDYNMLPQSTQNGIEIKRNPLFIWLILSYGFEGLGYIISGTFLVAIIERIDGLSYIAPFGWVVVGIGAIPSCYIWMLIGNKISYIKALYIAYFLQVIGIILPVIFPNVFGALIGAFLFGATFMGITTLTLAEARNLYPEESNRIIGFLTAAYGVGQVIGPAVAGVLTEMSGSYNISLIFAAIVLCFALVSLKQFQIIKQKTKLIPKMGG